MTDQVTECPACGSENVSERFETRTDAQFGLENVVLKNLRVVKCDECDSEAHFIPNHRVVMREIREKLCALRRVLTSGEFAFLRQALNINGQQVAEALGVTNVTISRWETGAQQVKPMADRLLRTFTLNAIGQRVTPEHFIDLSKSGVERVEIDLSRFSGKSYKYQSNYRFGGSVENAWVIKCVGEG
jgi:putative zinc finger/helix-turn-helix YgiT family protein